MDNWKNKYKEELNKKTTEDLKNDLIDLKRELLYMNNCLNDNSISGEQKSEFINSDIPSTKESIEFIEDIIRSRKI